MKCLSLPELPAFDPSPPAAAAADQVQENPLKAETRSADGRQRFTVVVRQSTAFKRTLTQVTGVCGGGTGVDSHP